jgi:hypothetical protein
MLNRDALAADILADLTAERVERDVDIRLGEPTKCFVCRAGMIYRGPQGDDASGRFCGPSCRTSYDRGLRYRPTSIRYPWPATKSGFIIACPGCSQDFDSKGLAFCSPDCQRKAKDRQEAEAVAAEAGHEVRNPRLCDGCGTRIPRYTASGRATKKSVTKCAKCTRRVVRAKSAVGRNNGLESADEMGVSEGGPR